MDYKNTINLPKTKFPMKAELAKKEPLILKQWQDIQLYHEIRKQRKKAPKYILHDGPPYPTGDVHVGTGITKVDKDIVVRFKTMQGFNAPFIPGWDCHGLPIEHKVMTELGPKAQTLSQTEIRQRCRDYAMKYVKLEREQFKSLGVLGDWEKPYLTMDPSYEAGVLDVFGDLVGNGYIYRGLKAIHWCPFCATALAEAELIYKDKTSNSIYLRFPMITPISEVIGETKVGKDVPFSIMVWTTTPWTLPANVATAVHPGAEYAVVEYTNPLTQAKEVSMLASALLERVFPILGIKDHKIITKIKGKQLEGKKYRHPLFNHECPLILANYVTLEDGTGCVHTAPGHGAEDFKSGQAYKLPIVSPVDPHGKFTDEAKQFKGLQVFQSENKICQTLADTKILLNRNEIVHSYPHCWRCKKPIIFRATEQWFVAVDHKDARKKALAEINRVRWVPSWGKGRISSMLQDRPDWCISRQRVWGVPIPAFYCTKCGTVLLDKAVVKGVRDIVAKEGTDAWFIHEADYFLPKNTKCTKCANTKFRKETDIVDVWLESGSSHRSVVMQHPELSFPADLYIEGTDQHRGWFQLSLLPSIMTQGKAPFKTVVTNGFVVDETGEKLSKSKGGLTPVDQIVKEYGADLYRLWFAYINFTEDIPFSLKILKEKADPYRKIRNTFRYLLGNLNDFDPTKNSVDYKELLEIDRWALNKLHRLIKSVTQAYEDFEFYRVFRRLYEFCVVDMSAFYCDILKDRLYTFAPNSQARRSAQTVLFEILVNLTKLFAPVLVFTTEEIWSYVPGKKETGSIHLASWPKPDEKLISDELETQWQKLIKVRSEVAREVEKLRKAGTIGSSLEAQVTLYAEDAKLAEFLTPYQKDLAMIFIVSDVVLEKTKPTDAVEAPEMPKLHIKVERSPAQKCVRCWQYHATVGKESSHPDICQKCLAALKEGGQVK